MKKKYETVLKKFEDYFVPIKNESVSSHIFFTRNQEPGEMFDAYLTELKKLSNDCNFGTLKDRLIRDRVVAGILDKRVKDRLLRETDLTLEKTIKICKSAELSEQHVKKFEDTKEVANINKKQQNGGNSSRGAGNDKSRRVQPKQVTSSSSSAARETSDSSKQEKTCQRCGYKHRYQNCPAFNKKCNKCDKTGHFAKMCNNDKRSVRVVDVKSDKEYDNDVEEFFCDWISINSINAREEWIQKVNFIDSKKTIAFKIDSGAQCNVIPIDLCKKLNIKECAKSNVILKNYNQQKIKTIGKVKLKCKIGNIEKEVDFEIFDGKNVPILGLQSSIDFNLIKRVNPDEESKYVQILNACSVNKDNENINKYKNIFNGYGKIKDFQYKIELKEGSVGKVEPCRHVPFKLINKLKVEIKRMEAVGIISKIEKPTDFVNSLVVVGKSDGSIRICLDPQYLNSCIKREHVQLPTVEEISAKIKNAKYFTKLDAKKGF